MRRLKKARASNKDLLQFYMSIIRPVCEYAAPAWGPCLTSTQKEIIENIQKRAFRIIAPDMTYKDSLRTLNQLTLEERRRKLCEDFFSRIQNPKDKIHDILPEHNLSKYSLRNRYKYKKPRCRTSRYKNSFLPFVLENFQ